MALRWSKLKKTRYEGVRIRPEDGAFVIRVRRQDARSTKRIETTRVLQATTLEEVLAERAKLAREMSEGEHDEGARPARETLSGYARLWILRKSREGLRTHTINVYLEALEKHILPHLGDVYVDALSTRDILGWRDWVSSKLMANGKPYSAWSLASWFSVLRNIIGDAVLEYELQRDPCHGVRGVKKPKAPRATRYLNTQQLQEFLRLVSVHCPQHRAITLILILYGLRWEEASALHQEHLDEAAGELRIVQAHVRGKIFPTKNENHKMLPLNDEVVRAIEEHKEMLRIRGNPGLDSGLLFPSIHGGYRLPNSVHKGWKTVSKAMGLTWTVTPHDLRRSYQNLLRQASVNQVVQQALMGHSSDAMTEHYSHVNMEEKRQAQQRVVNLLDFKNSREKEKAG